MASATLRNALNRLIRYNAVVYDVISYSLSSPILGCSRCPKPID
jgi:hypothetical protein